MFGGSGFGNLGGDEEIGARGMPASARLAELVVDRTVEPSDKLTVEASAFGVRDSRFRVRGSGFGTGIWGPGSGCRFWIYV